MALTPTAQRMMDTLPDYYWGNTVSERIIQAYANEVDRLEAMIDALIAGMIPGAATDEVGLLAVWEQTLGLPVQPAGLTEGERQTATAGAMRRQDGSSGADVLDLLTAAIGAGFTVDRDTPGPLEDTINVPFLPGDPEAGRLDAVVRDTWSAHRTVWVHFSDGSTAVINRPIRIVHR